MDALSGSHPKIDWEATDLVTAWKSFQQHTEFWFAGPLAKTAEAQKCNYLMIWIGNKGRDIYSTWDLSEDDKKKLEVYYQNFEKHVRPKSNKIYSRYKFLSRVQKDIDTFEEYLTDLKILVKDCGYATPEEMVRDAIVFGTKDHKVREKCITEGSELSLEKAINFARTYELSKAQLKTMESEDKTINMLNKQGSRSNNFTSGKKYGKQYTPQRGPPQNNKGQSPNFANKCKNCGELNTDEWTETINVNDVPVNFQLDTGAKCNVLSLLKLKTICSHPIITKQVSPLRSYSGHIIDTVGVIHLRCSYKCQDHAVKFHIVDRNVQSVIGAKTCEAMKLLKRIHSITQTSNLQETTKPVQSVIGAKTCEAMKLLKRIHSITQTCNLQQTTKPFLPEKLEQQYGDLFTGLGCLPGTHKIRINKTVAPVVHAPRKIPIAIKDKVKAELDRMEDIGVIFKQQEPTQWVNSMVTVIKPNGKIRICIDPRDLNKAILREHYPLKTVEEVISQMPNAKVFTKLETPFGRYRFARLPFGINSASEVFQKIVCEMVSDIEGAEAIIDDILILGSDQKEHDMHLKQVLDRASEYNLKLSAGKCEISKPEVTYVGHRLTSEGVKPDPEKIRAVNKMSKPECVRDLQTFMGFIQYLGKFMPNMSTVSAPLRTLLEKKHCMALG
ncbi:unnamed protein product [Mytilus coruscus]|uniref:Reverse transcriptase domain-containing protein n=1 Tax=Mytilus coruscus TaxID=42192 RepID=A0A6J8AXP4_MYTCO|nr:unnamed protein product [Mytilus coruscus]